MRVQRLLLSAPTTVWCVELRFVHALLAHAFPGNVSIEILNSRKFSALLLCISTHVFGVLLDTRMSSARTGLSATN